MHRNLGKAFYENPVTQNEAVAEFKKALDLAPASVREKLNYGLALLRAANPDLAVPVLLEVQRLDPSLPHTWFNLGVYYKKAGDAQKALPQFERMVALAPTEPIGHYQLGTVYRLLERLPEARAEFERAAALDPLLAGARFQLYNLERQAGRTAEAARYLETFQALRAQAQERVIPEDVDWCVYSEIYDPPATPPASTPAPAPTYADQILRDPVDLATGGLAVIDSTGLGQADLLVWSSRGIVLYRNGFQPAAGTGLETLTGVRYAAAGDFDNDGLMDLCIVTNAGAALYRNTKGRWTKHESALPAGNFERAVWMDYDHDYDLDLLLLGESNALARNQGAAGFADRTPDFPFVAGHATGARKLRVQPDSKAFDLAVFYQGRAPVLYRDQLGGRYATAAYDGAAPSPVQVEADFNRDGRLDVARVSPDGKVHLLRNQTRSDRRWIRVQLTGVKSLKLAQDAQVEIKAGTLHTIQIYSGTPLLFDTGAYTTVDAVRITWPNGLIQNEVNQATNRAYVYKEAQRLSGSCPMVWTWNGREFTFITDVLGVAPLGASDGDGSYFPVDHDEYVSIPASSLRAENGRYQVRLTEELSEVSYLDQIQLYAVDHPASSEVYTSEKFQGPPFQDLKLYMVDRRTHPSAARDSSGRDVLSRLLERDRRYPDQFARASSGVAELHSLELEFPAQAAPNGRALLLLNGWVDWPDGSTFRAISQEKKGGLVMPYLETQDEHGVWRTVNPDMGMPAGKPKTIVVELQFPAASRKLRITTNLCVYWDEIFLSPLDSSQPSMQALPLTSAALAFRGFSASTIHPERKQPDQYFYGKVSPVSFWNPTSGFYTRYGDTLPLLRDVDDRMVIMGSGDEVRLEFQADALPPVPQGWRRDFLLKVDGWAKDRDPNTAFANTVDPLPFHGMSRYPYLSGESFPRDDAHEAYRREYNTRPALKLIRPLASLPVDNRHWGN